MTGNWHIPPSIRPLHDLWSRLTEPSPLVQEAWRRREAQSLAALLFTLTALGLVVAVIGSAVYRPRTPETDLRTVAVIASLALLGIAYGLSRTRHYSLAAGFTVVLCSLSIFVLLLPARDLSDLFILAYLLVPVLVASTFYSMRTTVLVAAANVLASLLVFPVLPPGGANAELFLMPLLLIVVMSALLVVAARHRDLVAQDRQAQLAESESRYRQLVEHSPNAICICVDGEIVFINAAGARLLGRETPAQAVGRHLAEFTHPDDREQVAARLREAQAQDAVAATTQHRLVQSAGAAPIDVQMMTVPVAHQGRPAVAVVLRDITAHTQAQQTLQHARDHLERQVAERAAALERANAALAEERNLLRTLIDSLQDRIYVKDTEGRFILVNRAVARLHDEDAPEKVIGKTDFDYYPREAAERFWASDRQVIESGQMVEWEEPAARKGEGKRWVWVLKAPLRDLQGNIVGLIGVNRDVTEKKQAEAALQRAHAELEQRVQERTAELLAANQQFQQEMAERVRAEAALRESEARFRAIFENAATGIGVVNARDQIVESNAAMQQMLGYSAEELCQMTAQALTHPDDWAVEQPLIDEILKGTRDHYRIEKRYICKDGRPLWVRLSASVIRDGEGNVRFGIGMADDITERKRIEVAEREQRALAEALRDTAAALNRTLDYDEVLERILTNVGRVVPYDRANVMLIESGYACIVQGRGYGEHHEAVLKLRFSIADTHNLHAMLETGEPFTIPDTRAYFGWLNRPETSSALSYIGAPIRLGKEVIGFLNLDSLTPGAFAPFHVERLQAFADQAATAIKNARLYRESQERNRRLALLNQITRIGTATLDMKILLQSLADSAVDVIGGDGCFITLWDATRQQAIPAAAYGLQRDSYPRQEPSGPDQPTLTRTALETGRPLVVEDVLATPYAIKGGYFESHGVRSALTLPLQADGSDVGALIISFREIHRFTPEEIAWAEQAADLIALAISKAQAYAEMEQRVEERTAELRAANARLQALGRIKDEFVANVSHELRTPIASLKLYHDLLRRNPQERVRYAERLERETRRLEQLVEDLLHLSRMEQGQVDLEPGPVDLNALAEQYALDRALLAEERGLRLSLDAQPGVPPVWADAQLLGQALSALLTNALNYTPRGGQVTLMTRTTTRESGQWAGIGVADTGPGIPAEEQPHLFERFYRGQAARETSAPGTGLGLSIAREIIERHGGEIEVISAGVPGQGATFIIWLPVDGGARLEAS